MSVSYTHLALAGAVLLAIGGFLALAAWAGSPRTLLGQRTMSIAWAGLGVLSLLAAAGIYFVAQKMRRGAPILTAWAVVPGLSVSYTHLPRPFFTIFIIIE